MSQRNSLADTARELGALANEIKKTHTARKQTSVSDMAKRKMASYETNRNQYIFATAHLGELEHAAFDAQLIGMAMALMKTSEFSLICETITNRQNKKEKGK